MLTQPETTGILNAEHLEELEATEPVAPEAQPFLTLTDAVEALRRIKYHQGRISTANEQAQALIAPLQAEIERIRSWATEQTTDADNSVRFHESRLHAFYRLNPPTKTQTIKLPGGSVAMTNPADKWEWGKDEKALVAQVKAALPALVHSETVTVETVSKNDIKKAARVEDGKAYLISGEGEKVEIPVRVIPQPATYKVEVE